METQCWMKQCIWWICDGKHTMFKLVLKPLELCSFTRRHIWLWCNDLCISNGTKKFSNIFLILKSLGSIRLNRMLEKKPYRWMERHSLNMFKLVSKPIIKTSTETCMSNIPHQQTVDTLRYIQTRARPGLTCWVKSYQRHSRLHLQNPGVWVFL